MMEEENKPKPEPAMDGPKPPRKPPKVALALLPPDDDGEDRGRKPDHSQRQEPCADRPQSAIATEAEVVCPGCNTCFPITPEVWNAVAECSECGIEFEIKSPPGKHGKSEQASRA